MSKFTSLLATLPAGMVKQAAIESPDEQQLEADFGQLAYAFLKDRAAGLIPYMLGFEVVDREEDGSRAVGIFGFKLGEEYYYVPAFFVNGQIKGMDLLYSKKTNMFMPLREGWIDYLINRQTIRLGEPATEDKNKLQEQFEQPRFDFLAVPPTSPTGVPKTAEDKSSLGEVIRDGFSAWNTMQNQTVDMLEKDGEFQAAFGGAIARLQHVELPFEKTAEASPLIDWLQKKGGVPAVNALMRTMTENHGFAKAAMTFYPTVESLYVTNFAPELETKKEAAKITVITEQTDYTDGKERRRLVRDGFTIRDNREDEEKSETYDIDYTKRFQSPDKSGLYNILLTSGGTTQAWVFMPSEAAKCPHCVVVEVGKKNYFLAEPGAVYARGTEFIEGPSAFDAAVALNKIEPGRRYILINNEGNCSMPFEVKSVVAENGKRVKAKVYWRTYPKYDRPTYGHDFEKLHTSNPSPISTGAVSPNEDYIQLAEHTGGKLSSGGKDSLVVPSNWKALELYDGKSSMDNYEVEQIMEDIFQPGTLTDVMDALCKNAFHKLTVGSDDGLDYYIRFDDDFVDGRPTNYKTAMVRLVTKYGLSVDDAEDMLKQASKEFKSRRMVKLGQLVGVAPPNMPPQAMGSDPFTGATVVPPQIDMVQTPMTGVPKVQNSVQPGFNLGGEAEMDIQAAGLAQQAGQAGQKHVFDHAAIGGLARLYDTSSVIDSYIPELMKSLDRLGRILFLFYWKNEEFAERYGTEDLAELEDTIRGVFKSFGDLVLQLRQKAIDAEDAENAIL